MPIDINAILNETRGKNFELFEEHVNPVFVKVLRTLGFNRSWLRGEGPSLWDEAGTRYLDFLTNWGVFNFGRRHPVIRGALQQVLDSDFPGWVGFDAPPRDSRRLLGDLLSGHNNISTAAVGAVVYLPDRWHISMGALLPYPGSHNHHGMIFQVTHE